MPFRGFHKHPPQHTTTTLASLKPLLHLLPFFTIFPLSPPNQNTNENGIQWRPYSKVLNYASPTMPFTLDFSSLPKGWVKSSHPWSHSHSNPNKKIIQERKPRNLQEHNTHSHGHNIKQNPTMQSLTMQYILHWQILPTCRFFLQYSRKKMKHSFGKTNLGPS